MKKLFKGDYVLNSKHNTYHHVESIEDFDNKIVVFTEDSKCFPLEEVTKVTKSLLGDFFYKLLTKQKISEKEEREAISKMKEMNLVWVEK
jgi:hypothetical protein